jgi:hypothetical protein
MRFRVEPLEHKVAREECITGAAAYFYQRIMMDTEQDKLLIASLWKSEDIFLDVGQVITGQVVGI